MRHGLRSSGWVKVELDLFLPTDGQRHMLSQYITLNLSSVVWHSLISCILFEPHTNENDLFLECCTQSLTISDLTKPNTNTILPSFFLTSIDKLAWATTLNQLKASNTIFRVSASRKKRKGLLSSSDKLVKNDQGDVFTWEDRRR